MKVRTTDGWKGVIEGVMVTSVDLGPGESMNVEVGTGRAVVLLMPAEEVSDWPDRTVVTLSSDYPAGELLLGYEFECRGRVMPDCRFLGMVGYPEGVCAMFVRGDRQASYAARPVTLGGKGAWRWPE